MISRVISVDHRGRQAPQRTVCYFTSYKLDGWLVVTLGVGVEVLMFGVIGVFETS